MIKNLKIILGSSSVNRKELLQNFFDDITIISPDIDEKKIRCDDIINLPLLIAKAKTEEVIKKLNDVELIAKQSNENSFSLLITSDQISVFDNQVREKPKDKEEAINFLKSYSSKSVETISSIIVTNLNNGKQEHTTVKGLVKWNIIPDQIIEKVVKKGKIFNACGGFCIEDEDLKNCINEIEGGEDNIRGLHIKSLLHCIVDVIT